MRGDRWPDDARLSDLGPRFVCSACGTRGADVRPDFASVAGGSDEQFRAGIARAIALGWLWRHESGTYVKFTDRGAALFA